MTPSEIEGALARADGYHGGYSFEQTKALVQILARAYRAQAEEIASLKKRLENAKEALKYIGTCFQNGTTPAERLGRYAIASLASLEHEEHG